MKKYSFLILFGLFFVSVHAQRKPKIKGNKNVVEVREELEPFTSLVLADDLDVLLQKSTKEGYALELDDNLVDILKFKVADSILTISSFYNITAKKKLSITVFFQELTNIEISQGRISMKDVISSSQFTANVSKSAKLELNASADVLNITMSDNSFGDFNVASDSLSIILKDRVDAKIYATGATSSLYLYKNASAKVEGTTGFLASKLYGNAHLKADRYQAENILLVLEDSPNAKVRALESLQLSSKGSSRTSLYGNPKITILDFLDSSHLDKEKD